MASEQRQKLTIKNQYMFNRVMTDEDICIKTLERILNKKIESLEYKNAEQAFEPLAHTKGVRLDLFAKGENKVYDIELQIQPRKDIAKRYR
ncbi:PD-(D/E)XK nuclease family transposase, partial [Adlercreutzia sp. ZJ304]|uniref:PD-(D/E)XK nuclease family transposase n=2 Tax=Adlercreutzia sp. ZJ304 TaxID=2709791 RepID=UPI0019825B40